jgi:hypothetical protein
MFQYLPSPAAKEILDSVNSMNPCIAMKDDGYWNIHNTHLIWAHVIMISLPK